MNFTRKCPECNKEIIYKNETNLKMAIKGNRKCRSCAAKQDLSRYDKWLEKYGKEIADKKEKERREKISKNSNPKIRKGKDNPMYGKNFYDVWLEKYGKEIADEKYKQWKEKVPKHNNFKPKYGKENKIYGKSTYELWLNKYGKEIADEKYKKLKEKLSKTSKGKNNPMYGKPSPKGSGNGWSGHYKGINFRSILELSYLKYLLDNNIKFENGEKKKFKIPYQLEDGTNRNYFIDFYLLNTDEYIEIKPKKLINSPINKLKFKAAKELLGDKHKILTEDDIQKINLEKMYQLYLNGDIIWYKRYEKKFLDFYEKNKEMEK